MDEIKRSLRDQFEKENIGKGKRLNNKSYQEEKIEKDRKRLRWRR